MKKLPFPQNREAGNRCHLAVRSDLSFRDAFYRVNNGLGEGSHE